MLRCDFTCPIERARGEHVLRNRLVARMVCDVRQAWFLSRPEMYAQVSEAFEVLRV